MIHKTLTVIIALGFAFLAMLAIEYGDAFSTAVALLMAFITPWFLMGEENE